MPVLLERSIAQDPFTHSEVALMNQLFSHLRAAGGLAIRIGMASGQQIAATLSAAGHPLALLARDGCVLHMNERFERLLGDGLAVRCRRLISWQPDADRAFAAAIDQAVNYDGTVQEPFALVVLPRRTGLRPLVVQVVPVVGLAHDVLHLVAAMVTVTDLDAARLGPAEVMLEQAFGLTPAEARLAAQMAAGKTLADIAQEDGSARETLRSRLKSVFNKTRTGRQAELILLLAKISRS